MINQDSHIPAKAIAAYLIQANHFLYLASSQVAVTTINQ
jgi:hypothetical protein